MKPKFLTLFLLVFLLSASSMAENSMAESWFTESLKGELLVPNSQAPNSQARLRVKAMVFYVQDESLYRVRLNRWSRYLKGSSRDGSEPWPALRYSTSWAACGTTSWLNSRELKGRVALMTTAGLGEDLSFELEEEMCKELLDSQSGQFKVTCNSVKNRVFDARVSFETPNHRWGSQIELRENLPMVLGRLSNNWIVMLELGRVRLSENPKDESS